jgi:CMP-N-acetylneuraminic acid synthetase
MRVLFIIIARAGSKGIPGKNLLQIGGISLIGYKALSARQSKHCSRLILSSDCPAMQNEASKYGVEAPFTRPAELATDTVSSDDVVWHAMQYIEAQTDERYDAVMLLEPTSPFATHVDYDRAVQMMIDNRANVVVGMREVTINSVFQGPMDDKGRIGSIVRKLSGLRGLRRQDLPQEYTMNGAFYLMRWDFFKARRQRYCDSASTYGLVMKPAYSVEIDEMMDFEFAKFLVEQGHVDVSYWKTAMDKQVARA